MLRRETETVIFVENKGMAALFSGLPTGLFTVDAWVMELGRRGASAIQKGEGRIADLRVGRRLGWRLPVQAVLYARTAPLSLPMVKLGRHHWLFRDAVYATSEILDPDEVFALVQASENRTRTQIARAKAAATGTPTEDRAANREPIPNDVKIFIWQRDRARCVTCGSNANLEFDHIIPLALDGSNGARNLQLLCGACNRAKGANLV